MNGTETLKIRLADFIEEKLKKRAGK